MTAERLRTFLWRHRSHIGIAAVALAVLLLCRRMQEQGHGWGDDFALYINQARGLTDGSMAEVASLTRFALDNSAYNTFSAYVYPWVFPMLLAPIVALKGTDYSALKLVGTISFVVALVFLHRIVRHRAGEVAGYVIVLAIGLNNVYVGYTDAVLSDLTFLATVMITLWWLDRLIHAQRLFAASLRPLLGLGLLAAASFNTRREGIALVVAIAAAQAANWRSARAMAASAAGGWRGVARLVAAPYLAFAAATVALVVVLPSQPYPRFDSGGGSGWHNVTFNLKWYRLPLAELLGLKDIGPNQLSMLGSHGLAKIVFWSFLALVLVGVAWRLVRATAIDAHLAAALAGLAIVILSPPFREQRYLLVVLPLMLYFAWQGVQGVQWALTAAFTDRRFPAVLAGAAIAIIAVAVATDTRRAYDYHRDQSYVEWGPEHPDAQQAFAAVLQFTDARDVITFFQARTLNLYTRRRAIQGNSEQMMTQRADWFLMARNSDYIQTNLTDVRAAQLGFVKVWENDRFVLWRIPPRYPPLAARPSATP